MADLQTVEKRIAELKAQIEPTLKEIETLESAARVLRALDRGESVTRPKLESFAGLTMPKAAEEILLENAGQALHYKQITDIAIARGFSGRRTNMKAPRDQIAASFRRMMAQRKDIFEPVGRGSFKISSKYLEKMNS